MRKFLLVCLVWLACHCGNAIPSAYAQGPVTKTVYKDQDGDGHGDPSKPKSTNNPSQDYVTLADDCNDKDPSIFKGAKEIKDRKDNDCDGLIDEIVWYEDKDKDGYGSTVTKEAVTQPAGYTHRDGDTDDNDPTIYPNATDICDGKDNDGNGIVDDGGTRVTYYRDADGDTFGDPAVTILSCTEVIGYVTNNKDFDDRDATRYPNAPELCDGKDNDNDGSGDPLEDWYVDNDGDTYGAGPATRSCAVPSTTKQWVRNNEDADDTNNKVYPGAVEVCDNKDNNQDGTVDEGFTKRRFYRDADNDTYGDAYNYVEACSQPPGYEANNIDCDDTRFGVFRHEYYADNDGDGYGAGTKVLACPGLEPAGHVKNNTDANDSDNTVYPGATEVCDGKDNNQNGTVDEGFTKLPYYRDADNDGFGDPNNQLTACNRPNGYAHNDLDCDDTRWGTFRIDYYVDNDGDGYGTGISLSRCEGTQPTGWVTRNGDCNDSDNTIHPNQYDGCDYTDNDCDGQEDEDQGMQTWYYDGDGDGYGDPCNESYGCDKYPDGYVLRARDCNDNDPTVFNCSIGCDDWYARKAASGESEQTLAPVTSLHPNPATSELTIDLSRPAKELKSITISTVIDQKVSFTNHAVLGDSKVKITVTHLKSGVYVIRLDFGDGYEVLKFIKN